MKDFLEKMRAKKNTEVENLRSKIKESNDINEVRSLSNQLENVADEIRAINTQLETITNSNDNDPSRQQLNPIATYGIGNGNALRAAETDIEKRVAFANFVTRGKAIPAELRATTVTGDVGNVIPENLAGTIIEKIEAMGMILPLITKTNFPVGQKIAIDGIKPVASWVKEGAGSTVQGKKPEGSIVWAEYKLRCEISMSQEVTVQTLPAFENLFVKQVSEAMVKAIEGIVVSNNDGAVGCPKGILYNPNEIKNPDKVIEIAKAEKLTYKILCDAEGKIPQEYETGAKWFMTKKTFMDFIAITDSAGQPIARVNYGISGKAERTLLGRDVVLSGNYMPSYADTATEDITFAFLFDPSDYVLNTSYDLGIQSKVDWDTEDHRTKAVMSVDGQPIRRGSLVKLVKKSV